MATRRRKLWAAAAVLAMITLPLAPSLYWRTVGCLHNEPFWEGRPSTFWSQELRFSSVCARGGVSVDLFPQPLPTYSFQFPQSEFTKFVDLLRNWLDKSTKGILSCRRRGLADMGNDPECLAVLTALAGDNQPKVRIFAVKTLAVLGRKFASTRGAALRIIKPMLNDDGVLDDAAPKLTVGAAAYLEYVALKLTIPRGD